MFQAKKHKSDKAMFQVKKYKTVKGYEIRMVRVSKPVKQGFLDLLKEAFCLGEYRHV
jgi:hypothetical protein